MAKKANLDEQPRERSDAERRARQCARLANLMKVLHLISGRGRWDAKGLAEELECSQRTIHRMLSTLSMAGVPWYFDEKFRAYRIRPGFKFSLAENAVLNPECEPQAANDKESFQDATERLIEDGEAFAESLTQFLEMLKRSVSTAGENKVAD